VRRLLARADALKSDASEGADSPDRERAMIAKDLAVALSSEYKLTSPLGKLV